MKKTAKTINCLECGKEFQAKLSRLKRGHALYCSRPCMYGNSVFLEKIRKANLGRVRTPEVRERVSRAKILSPFTKRGIENPAWKGGVTPQNQLIRHSPEYRLWREAVFARDNWTCQGCNVRGGRLNADHIKPFALYPELRLAIDNGRTLCISCHQKTLTYGRKIKHAQHGN